MDQATECRYRRYRWRREFFMPVDTSDPQATQFRTKDTMLFTHSGVYIKAGSQFKKVTKQEEIIEWLGERMFEATERGDAELVRKILDCGANVNYSNLAGMSALHIACSLGFVDVVTLLLEKGAQIEMGVWDGLTPLHIAILHGKSECLKVLIEHGADVSKRTNTGWKPLHIALLLDNREIIHNLLEAGSDYVFTPPYRPLHWGGRRYTLM